MIAQQQQQQTQAVARAYLLVDIICVIKISLK